MGSRDGQAEPGYVSLNARYCFAGIQVLRRYDGFPSNAVSLRRIAGFPRVLNSLFIILRP